MASTEVAVIGTGWCGGIRAESLAKSALVDALHICEIRPERLEEVRTLTNPKTATLDYQDIVRNPAITVVYISTTPEGTHYPIARDCLKAGKHVLLEKPIALELWEADELIALCDKAADTKRWAILTFHGVDEGTMSVAKSELQSLIDYLKANTERLWTAPVATVAEAIRKYQAS